MTRPIAVSCGEPSGIGPEIAAKAWTHLRDSVPFVWIGDPRHLPSGTPHVVIDTPRDAAVAARTGMPVLPLTFAGPARPGLPDPANAASVIAAIERAVALVRDGDASALCTAPIHKKALLDGAAFAYPGHTEFLAALGGVSRAVMMLTSDTLRVVPVTIHIPLSKVPEALTAELLEETIRIAHRDLSRWFGIPAPRIAVAGLNPHAGEGGVMGGEEIRLISPALDRLRAEGLDIRGPYSADTMFHAAARSGYDVAVCMYHDQALIPIKTLAFDEGVNVTLGLPFIRTSPDHGTAFDIAGADRANPASLIAALRLAQKMAAAQNLG
jgi:4-hydroxythreonine-4-phosphate dehydrogenase